MKTLSRFLVFIGIASLVSLIPYHIGLFLENATWRAWLVGMLAELLFFMIWVLIIAPIINVILGKGILWNTWRYGL